VRGAESTGEEVVVYKETMAHKFSRMEERKEILKIVT
jgi:hypothetical protein